MCSLIAGTFMIIQVHGKNKMKVVEDKEEGNGIDLKNSPAITKNGCTTVGGDSVDESECPNEFGEDNVDEICETAELRPLKKAKSESAENCASGKADNCWFSSKLYGVIAVCM